MPPVPAGRSAKAGACASSSCRRTQTAFARRPCRSSPIPDGSLLARAGDAGIPPQLTPAPGQPVTVSDLTFPVPKRMDIGTVRDVGYDLPVTFPFTLTAQRGGKSLSGQCFYRMCRNICIPFQADLTVPLTGEDRFHPARSGGGKAKSRLPAPPSEDFTVTGFRMAADLASLECRSSGPAGSKPEPRPAADRSGRSSVSWNTSAFPGMTGTCR